MKADTLYRIDIGKTATKNNRNIKIQALTVARKFKRFDTSFIKTRNR